MSDSHCDQYTRCAYCEQQDTIEKLQTTVDECYNLIISEGADAMTDRKVLAAVTNKLADVAS